MFVKLMGRDTRFTDGDINNQELIGIKLDDTVNKFVYTTNKGGAAYLIPETSNGEKIMYELGKIFKIR